MVPESPDDGVRVFDAQPNSNVERIGTKQLDKIL